MNVIILQPDKPMKYDLAFSIKENQKYTFLVIYGLIHLREISHNRTIAMSSPTGKDVSLPSLLNIGRAVL